MSPPPARPLRLAAAALALASLALASDMASEAGSKASSSADADTCIDRKAVSGAPPCIDAYDAEFHVAGYCAERAALCSDDEYAYRAVHQAHCRKTCGLCGGAEENNGAVQYVAAFDALFPGARQLAGAGRAADATVAVANTCKKPTGSCATVEGMNEWREFFFCAFAEQNWVQYKWAEKRPVGAPVIFRFCTETFPGDEAAIRCCSNARCPWGNSPTPVYGRGIAICISPKWAVNICCPPCFCKVAHPSFVPVSGVTVEEATGLITRDGNPPVPIAMAFPCDLEQALFAPRALLSLDEILADVDCATIDDPMEIGGGAGFW